MHELHNRNASILIEIKHINRIGDEIRRRRWTWVGRILRGGRSSTVALGWSPEGRRAVRRPWNTWRRQAGWNGWNIVRVVARDKAQWKQNVTALCASWHKEHWRWWMFPLVNVWAHVTTFSILPGFSTPKISHKTVQQRTLPGFLTISLFGATRLEFGFEDANVYVPRISTMLTSVRLTWQNAVGCNTNMASSLSVKSFRPQTKWLVPERSSDQVDI